MCRLASTTIVLFLQIITSFLFTTTTSSRPSPSPPLGGLTFDLFHRRTNSSSSRPSNTNDGSSPYASTVFEFSEYVMKLQIGTPPVEIEAIIDTGSEVIWTQCLPCIKCFNQPAPIFDPSKSSTYRDKKCHFGPLFSHTCKYDITYANHDYSRGTYATETVTIQSTSGQPFVMPETTIGCGHDNSGLSSTPAASGIVGLDWGASSLISQMGQDYLGLFSYCFSGSGTSKINFGGNAIVAGDGVVTTPIFRKNEENYFYYLLTKKKNVFYYLNLDAISVGETRLETLGTDFHSLEGNIIIDSGTTYTYLPESYCNNVRDAVDKAVQAERSTLSDGEFCYNTDDVTKYPVITMHFSGGADLKMEHYNMFVQIGGSYCLAILCGSRATYRNRAQNNLLVGYDISSQLVSFKSTDCSTLWG
ncbi:unnamed protein product [Thlaspi arvense]|uniref:Peptidase A1 domain-containing protein n=1 Tax=Thlaspi arvense TaxID=13288 RepID=A0AAU9S8L4_THLAR|nr:unnamed protein product [Thlaspi arvense]